MSGYFRSSTSEPEFFHLSPSIVLPRIWVGLWQLSSNAWGTAPLPQIRVAMTSHVEMGYTAFGMDPATSTYLD